MKMDLNLVRTILWFSVYAIVSHGIELNCRFCFKYYLESCDGTYRVEIGNLALSEKDLQFTKQCSNKPFITQHGLLGGLSEQNLLLLNGEVVGHGGASSVEIENDQVINADVGNTDFKPEKQPSSVEESVDTDCDLTINTDDENNDHKQHNPGGVKPDQNHRNSGELEDNDNKIIVNTEEENQPEYPGNFQPNQDQSSDGASVGTDSLQINTEGESNVRQTQYPDARKPDQYPSHGGSVDTNSQPINQTQYPDDRKPDQYPSHGGSVDTNSQPINTEDENAYSQSQYPNGLTYDLHHLYNEGSVETGYYIDNEGKNTVHKSYYSDVLKPEQIPNYGGGSEEAQNIQPQYPTDFTPNQPPSYDKERITIDNQEVYTGSEITDHKPQNQVYPKPNEKPTFDEELERTEKNQPKYPNHDNEHIETDEKSIESENTVDQPQNPSDPKPDVSLAGSHIVHRPQIPDGFYPDYHVGSLNTNIHEIHIEDEHAHHEPYHWNVYNPNQYYFHGEESEEAENNQPQYPTDFTPNQPPSYDEGHINIDPQAIDTESEITDHKTQNEVYSKPDEKPTFDEELESTEKSQPKYPNHDNGHINIDSKIINTRNEITDHQPQIPSGPKPGEHRSTRPEGPHIVLRPQNPDVFYPDYDVGSLNTDIHEIHVEAGHAHPEPYHWIVYNPNQDSTHSAESEGTENNQPQYPTDFTPNQPPSYDEGHINIDPQAIDTESEITDHKTQNEVYSKPDEKPTFDEELESTEKSQPKYPNHDNGHINIDSKIINTRNEITDHQPQIPSGPKPGEHRSTRPEGPHIVLRPQNPDVFYSDYDVGSLNTDIHEIHVEAGHAHPEPYHWNVYNPNQDSTHSAESEGTENNQPQYPTDFTPNQPPSYDEGHINIDPQAIDTESEITDHKTQNEVYSKPDEKPTFDEELESTEKSQPKYPNHDNGHINIDSKIINTRNEITDHQPQIPSGPKPGEHRSTRPEGPHIVLRPQNPDVFYPDYDVGSLNTDIHEIHVEAGHAHPEPYHWNVYNPNQDSTHSAESEGTENNQPQYPTDFTPNQPPSYDEGHINIDPQAIDTESEITDHKTQNEVYSKPDEKPTFDEELESTEKSQPKYPNHDNGHINIDSKIINTRNEITDHQPQIPSGPKPGEHRSTRPEGPHIVLRPQNPDVFYSDYDVGSLNTDIHEIHVEAGHAHPEPYHWNVYNPNQDSTHSAESEGTENNQPQYPTDFTPNQPPSYDEGHINIDPQAIDTESEITDHKTQNEVYSKPDEKPTFDEELESTEKSQPKYPNHDNGHINIDSKIINTRNEITDHQPQIPSGPKPGEHRSTRPEGPHIVLRPQNPDVFYPDYDVGSLNTDIHEIHVEAGHAHPEPYHWNVYNPNQDSTHSAESEGTENNQPQYPTDFTPNQPPSYDEGHINIDPQAIDTESEITDHKTQNEVYSKPDEKPTFDEELESTEKSQPKYPNHDNGHINIDSKIINTRNEITDHQPQIPSGPKPGEHRSTRPEGPHIVLRPQNPDVFYPDYDVGSLNTDIHEIHVEAGHAHPEPYHWNVYNPNQDSTHSAESEGTENNQPQYPTDFTPNQPPSYDEGHINIDPQAIDTESEITDHKTQNEVYSKPDEKPTFDEELESTEKSQPKYPNHDNGHINIDSKIINTRNEITDHQPQIPSGPKPGEHRSTRPEGPHIVLRPQNPDVFYPDYDVGSLNTDIHEIHVEAGHAHPEPYHWNVYNPNQDSTHGAESQGTENNQPQYPTDFTPNQPPSYDEGHINIDHQAIDTESEITDHKPQNQVYSKPDEKPTYDEELESTEKNQQKYFNHDKKSIKANDQVIDIESEKSADQPQYPGGPKPDEHSSHSEGFVGTNIHLPNTDDQNTFYQPQYPNAFFFDLQHITGEGSLEAHSHLIKSEGQDTVQSPQYQDEPKQHHSYGGGSVDTASHLINTEIENTVHQPQYPDDVKPNQYQNNEEGSAESHSHLINIESQNAVNQPQNPIAVNPNQHPSNVEGSVESDSHLIDTEGQNTINKPQYPLIIDTRHIHEGSVETDNHRINTENENIVNQPQYPIDVISNQHPSSGDRLVETDSHLINTENKNIVNQPHTEGGNTINQQQYLRGFIPDQYHGNGGQQYYLNGFKPDQVPTYGGGLIGTESQHTGSIEFTHADQNPKYPHESQPNHLNVGSSMEMNSKREKYTDGSGHQSGNTHGKQSDQQVKEGTDRELAQSQLDSTEHDQIGSQEVEIEHEINHVSYPEQSSDHMFGTSMNQNYLFKRPVPRVPVTGVLQYLQIPSQHKVVQHVVHHHVHIPTYPQHLSSIPGMIEKQKLAECLKKYSSSTCKLLLEDKFYIPETNWYKLYSKYGKPTQQIPVKDPYVDESGAKHFLFSQVYGPYAQQSLPYIKHVPKLEEPSNAQSPEQFDSNSINALHLQGIHAGKTEEGTYSYPARFMRPYMPRNNQENYQIIHPTGFLENNPTYNPYFSSEKSANPAQMKSLNEFTHGSSGSVTGSKGKIFHKIVKKIRLRTRRKIRGRMLRRNNIDGSENYEDEDNTTENPNESGEYEGEEPETSEEEKNEKDNTTEDEEKNE